jgi:predicted permease
MMAFDILRQDLRYTLRTLRRDAGFTTFAVLIVGLGIGAGSMVFSLVNTLLVRPLPFYQPERLVWIANQDVGGLSGQTAQVGYLLDLRERNRSFTDLAAYFAFYGVGDTLLTEKGEPERFTNVPVSENFFPLLGVKPILGRLFTADECKWHGPKAVLLSYGLWMRRFAGDPAVVGRKLTGDGDPITVVGVLPASFDFASVFAPGTHVDLYSPFPLSAETNRWGNTLAIVGRLKPGVTPAAAQAELSVLAEQIQRDHPERNGFGGKLTPLAEHVSGRLRTALVVLACAVGAVMLIVCANISNLLLVRTSRRQKEIAVRTALGAGRGRLIRQALTESIVLSTGGALFGLLLALGGTRALSHLDAIRIPLLSSIHIDRAALGFTLAVAVLTGLVFGLAPALQVPAAALHGALKDSSHTTEGRRRSWIRNSLVVSEIAFACVLLVAAGLLIRSFVRVLDVNLGFQPERAAALRVDPHRRPAAKADENAYYDEVLRRARAVPGIHVAGLTDALPLGRNRTWGAAAKGQVYERGRYPLAFVRIVSDGYLQAMGIALRGGRDISERDTPSSDAVIVINQTMARRLWPAEDPIGKIVRADRERRVVGIAADVRHLALEEGSGMEMYIPLRQVRDFSSIDLVVRSALPPAELASVVRAALRPIEPSLAGNDFRTLQQLVDRAVSPRRFIVMLLGGFALFALILAALGIYGVISYSVGQRTREIGIRMALGAPAADLQFRILTRTLALAALGMALGAAASWSVARSFQSLLFEVAADDPATFLGMLIVLLLVAAIAGYLPARRASAIDPVIALRAE